MVALRAPYFAEDGRFGHELLIIILRTARILISTLDPGSVA